jgi:CheY-like chemotaxis protein
MSQSPTCLGKILVVDAAAAPAADLVEPLRSLGDVTLVRTSEAATQALRQDNYALIVLSPENLAEAQRLDTYLQLNSVLDAIAQGVCIIDTDGRVVWTNSRLSHFPDEIRERIRRHCLEGFGGPGAVHRPRSLSLVTEGDHYYDVTITPITDPQRRQTQLVAVVSDVTRARRLQRKMDAIDNAGRELVCVDPEQLGKMDVRQRLELLERKVIRYTRELLLFNNFAIRLLDKRSNKLELVLCAGYPAEAQQIDIYASTENSGISGYVAATGRSYICPDVRNDPRYLVGINDARSSLTVPLRLHDHVLGVFNIESDRVAGFTEEDRQFAEIFGRYVAIALHFLDVLVVERHTATGRLADNVTAEIAGPLGNILADASTLMEDYIGHDDLRHRLQAISDNVVKIKESIKQVVQPADGILGSKPKGPQSDPVLQDKKILVVDDEEIIRVAVRDVLSKHGSEVEIARDGDEALAMISQRSYDLVISDIRMPGHDGYQIFAAVKDMHPDCPVIFMTGFGYDPSHSIIRARQEGLAAVLYKPFKVDQLLSDVRAALSGGTEASK